MYLDVNGRHLFFEPELQAGTIVYDGEHAEACLDHTRTMECVAFGQDPSRVYLLYHCAGELSPFVGTVAEGGSCVWSEECVSTNCLWDDASGTATCRPIPGAGEACYDVCAEGLYCSWWEKQVVCNATKKDAAPCTFSPECQSGYCDYSGGGEMGVCGPVTFCNGP
jgi:hypothetical protein